MTRTHRVLAGVVVVGAVTIAGIGFAGSYAAVRALAVHEGFGWFANVFPIGVDAGIVVLLALDLLLTWFRIPFPLLRQTAWLLTGATIAFNGAAAWPDLLGVGMHAVIPVLFVVTVEAARHAIGRIADITADRHMESVRVARWLLAFPSTFRLWRRMKLWELRSYDEVIRVEQDRLVYRARLRAKYGRSWRRKAPVESLMPLRLSRYGVPLAETAPAGLAAAGIEAPVAAPQLPVGTALESSPAQLEQLEHEPSANSVETPAETDERPVPETELEYIGMWKKLQDDIAGPADHPRFQPVAGVELPHQVMPEPQYAGAPPARDHVPAVHARLPIGDEPPVREEQPVTAAGEPSIDAVPDEPVLQGKAGLRQLYLALSRSERRRSDNSLAPELAPRVGLKVHTARKYIGEFRRELESR